MTERGVGGDEAGVTPGALLAQARQVAGLTVADVAGQMRISLRQVEAIESDRYDQLPGAVFVRGFVRNYARLLNIDPLPLLRALEPALGAEAPLRAQNYAGSLPVGDRRGTTRLWIAVFVVVAVCVLGAAAYEYWRSRSGTADGGAVGTAAGSAASPAGSPASPQPAPGVTSEPIPLTPERIDQAPAPSAPASAEATAATAVPGPSSAPAAESGATRGGRIAIAFVAESWIEVRDRDGNILLSFTGTPNTSRTVEGNPPFAITIGNAGGVRISYNDRPVDVAAHATRNIARFSLE